MFLHLIQYIFSVWFLILCKQTLFVTDRFAHFLSFFHLVQSNANQGDFRSLFGDMYYMSDTDPPLDALHIKVSSLLIVQMIFYRFLVNLELSKHAIIDLDRKSTRLYSSHVSISYAV